MSQLTADTVQSFETPGIDNEFGVLDNVIVYRGSALGSSGGYARQLVAADLFLGFAENKADNTGTGHASGAKKVAVRREGYVQLAITSLAVTDINKAVYASDGNTYTLTAGSNTLIGRVHRWVSTGIGIIYFSTNVQAAS